MTDKLIADIEFLTQKINVIERANYVNSLKIEDTYALNLLQPLINGYPFLPFSGSSLRPFCLTHILNDIMVNQRKNIIEFGSGISTIIIGRLIKKNCLDAELLSVEHDENWVGTLKEILKNEKVDDVIKVIYAPLKKCKIAIDNNEWYSIDVLNKATKNKKFDMVIVDGPPAWEKPKAIARYPAVPFISNKLTDKFSIYLDDAVRMGEQAVLRMWEAEYGVKFNIAGKTLAYYYAGGSNFTEPLSYY